MIPAFFFSTVLVAFNAFAAEGDPCDGLDEGDDCTERDGDEGVCQEDDDDDSHECIANDDGCDDDDDTDGDDNDDGDNCAESNGDKDVNTDVDDVNVACGSVGSGSLFGGLLMMLAVRRRRDVR
jgi:hypothetical protein